MSSRGARSLARDARTQEWCCEPPGDGSSLENPISSLSYQLTINNQTHNHSTLRILPETSSRDVTHLLEKLLPNSLRVSLPAAKIHERFCPPYKAFLTRLEITTLWKTNKQTSKSHILKHRNNHAWDNFTQREGSSQNQFSCHHTTQLTGARLMPPPEPLDI